jgi:hypothetical protein
MDLKIKKVSEVDFDRTVMEAGGARINETDSADYIFGEAILELKLVEEEGLDKGTRQQKLANLFRPQQPLSPVVVIAPNRLDKVAARTYYNIIAGPIKTHVKKAAAQRQNRPTTETRRSASTRNHKRGLYRAVTR